MTRTVLSGLAAALSLGLAGCGGDAPDPREEPGAGAAATNAAATSDPAAATASGSVPAPIEQAYRCRGLVAAALAASRVIPKDQLPAELAALDPSVLDHWNGKMGEIAAGTIDAGEEARLMTEATRILVTPEELHAELPAIRACIAAAAG